MQYMIGHVRSVCDIGQPLFNRPTLQGLVVAELACRLDCYAGSLLFDAI